MVLKRSNLLPGEGELYEWITGKPCCQLPRGLRKGKQDQYVTFFAKLVPVGNQLGGKPFKDTLTNANAGLLPANAVVYYPQLKPRYTISPQLVAYTPPPPSLPPTFCIGNYKMADYLTLQVDDFTKGYVLVINTDNNIEIVNIDNQRVSVFNQVEFQGKPKNQNSVSSGIIFLTFIFAALLTFTN